MLPRTLPRMLPSNKSRSPSSSASSASFWIALASLVSSHQFHSFQRWLLPDSHSSNALFEVFEVFEVFQALPSFQLVNLPFKYPLAAQLCPPEAPRTPRASKTEPVRRGSQGSLGSLVAAKGYIGDIYIYINTCRIVLISKFQSDQLWQFQNKVKLD